MTRKKDGPRTPTPNSTLYEERREVIAGVLEAVQVRPPDADRLAACARLLRHLARTGPRCETGAARHIM